DSPRRPDTWLWPRRLRRRRGNGGLEFLGRKVMKRSIAALVAAVALTAAAPSLAAEITGKVQKADNEADTLLLVDGTLFYLGEGATVKGLKPGTEVTVTFEDQSGLKVATAIRQKK